MNATPYHWLRQSKAEPGAAGASDEADSTVALRQTKLRRAAASFGATEARRSGERGAAAEHATRWPRTGPRSGRATAAERRATCMAVGRAGKVPA